MEAPSNIFVKNRNISAKSAEFSTIYCGTVEKIRISDGK